MSTVQAFNTMLKSFMEELADVFPEETQIAMFLQGFDALVALNPRGPMDMFVDSLAPHTELAMAKNPELFKRLKFPGGIDFDTLWASDISDNTRDAIWQYLNLLLLLGTTVRSMPAEMLQGIEAVAKNCADQMQSGEMDFSALGSMLMNGGLAGLAVPGAGAGQGPPAEPRAEPPAGPRAVRPVRSSKKGGRRR